MLEWECCLKHPEQGAAEGAPFIAEHIIQVTETAFDDFAAGGADEAANRAHARHRSRGRQSMTIEGRDDQAGRRLRLGMVGGGQGAFIGAVHRIAARLDDHYELVAGRAVVRPGRAPGARRQSFGLAPDRIYGDFEEMATKEAARDDGIEAVAIVTPNHIHHPAAKAFLEAGIHVICDKPLTTTLDDALDARADACSQHRPDLRPHPQLHRLSDGARRRARWWRRASSARSAWCRSNTRRTG